MSLFDLLRGKGKSTGPITRAGRLSPIFPPADLPQRSPEAHQLFAKGLATFTVGDLTQSLRHFKDALKLCERTGYRSGEVRLLYNIGVVQFALRHFDDAIRTFELALVIAREITQELEAEMREYARQAEQLARSHPGIEVLGVPQNERQLEGMLLRALATVHEANGQSDLAAESKREADRIAGG